MTGTSGDDPTNTLLKDSGTPGLSWLDEGLARQEWGPSGFDNWLSVTLDAVLRWWERRQQTSETS